MKTHYKALFLCAAVSAIAVSQASALQTNFTFVNGLQGENEATPNASAGSGTINTLLYDSEVGSFGTFTVDVDFTGLSSNATAAHIHGPAAVGVSAGVLQGLSENGGTSGKITGSWALSSATDVDSLFNGLTYINLHSETFGGGELRGQLTPVPEPSAAAGILGLCALALVGRRRRSRI
jgi:hypothetical protein